MHRSLIRILLHLLSLPVAFNYPQILPKSQKCERRYALLGDYDARNRPAARLWKT